MGWSVIKYCAMAGHVLSQDGDYHYISSQRVMQLYGVNPKECITAPLNRKGFRLPDGVVALYPMSNGDYSLPEDKPNPS